MKKIFALPGVLLPISLLAVGVFIGNSAIDIKIHDHHYSVLSTNLYQLKFTLPFFISWVFHIVLGYINQPPQKWAWLQVAISLTCLFVFYISLDSSLPGTPRRYYDDNAFEKKDLFGMGGKPLLLAVVMFYTAQVTFWIYGLIALIKKLAI